MPAPGPRMIQSQMAASPQIASETKGSALAPIAFLLPRAIRALILQQHWLLDLLELVTRTGRLRLPGHLDHVLVGVGSLEAYP
jgi:hypothetical protein